MTMRRKHGKKQKKERNIFMTKRGDSPITKWDDIDHRGDSFHDFPTYIKHWEEAKPWGWELRILTENGLHTFNLKWKDYKRPRELSQRKHP